MTPKTESHAPWTVDEMRNTLVRGTAGFACEPIPMSEATSWRVADGAISHVSGGYFSVVGAAPREPRQQPLVLLFQPQSAFNGLLTATIDGELHLLLQARVEPGNIGVAQYGPTVQSTPANYLRVHGGRATPYLEYFHRCSTGPTVVGDWSELDLGGRYLFKNKRLVCLELAERPPLEDNFVWVPASVIKQAVRESALMNTDLRSLLAVMPWGQWPTRDDDSDLSRAAHDSLRAPVRPDTVGRVVTEVGRPPVPSKLVPLSDLPNWELTAYGLFEREPVQGFDVQFYRVEAPTREVSHWTQPLLNSRTAGKVVLALTVCDGTMRALVQVRSEPGLSTGAAVFPSHLVLPGEVQAGEDRGVYERLVASSSATLARTRESDEGGRFYQDESDFEVLLVDDAEAFGEGFLWLTLSELKCLLARSNLCSLQMRCIASMLLWLL